MTAADPQLPLFDAAGGDERLARRSEDGCRHPITKIHTLNCGAGGIQYREYCLICWADLRGAIRHSIALEALAGEPAPVIDIDVVREARDAWWRGRS